MNERTRQRQAGMSGTGRQPNGIGALKAWARNAGAMGAVLALALMAMTAAATPAAWAAAPAAGLPGATGAGAAATQYAIVVNGDDSFTHNYNVELALGSLRQLGYEPRNTFVLAPAAPAAPAAAAGAAGSDAAAGAWRQPATEQGLRRALAELRGRLRSGDRLLVYLTGHGYRMLGRASLGLQNGSITAQGLMQRLGELPFGELILVADQCYSGAFVDAALALGRNVVAISSTDDRHEVRCEPFVRPLWLAAAESGSIAEAFQTASSGLHRAGGQAGEAPPRYATSGSCAGPGSRCAISQPSRAAAALAAGGAAGPAAAADSATRIGQR
jgi:hypothetical protein